MKTLFTLLVFVSVLVLSGCAHKRQATDYSAFRESNPRSILVLPPKNQSPDVGASHSFLSVVTMPLAESGYYVFPVAVVEETFKRNGVTSPDNIHSIPLKKMHDIFAADAVLYITVINYGTSYQIISSDTRVTAIARLVDLRSGKELWKGSGTASTNENQSSNNNGFLGMLISAAVSQIANTVTDKSHKIAEITSVRMFSAGTDGALLYGPRSPDYGKTALK